MDEDRTNNLLDNTISSQQTDLTEAMVNEAGGRDEVIQAVIDS